MLETVPSPNKVVDIDPAMAIKRFVNRIETAMRDIANAQDDLKAIVFEAKEACISPKDIASMKTIAKLRLKDQIADAREKLESLERISRIVQLDLFGWAEILPP
jgi:uncharacterized protein (UPF0335 family)